MWGMEGDGPAVVLWRLRKDSCRVLRRGFSVGSDAAMRAVVDSTLLVKSITHDSIRAENSTHTLQTRNDMSYMLDFSVSCQPC